MGRMKEHEPDPYAVLSRFYDLEFDGFEADVDMYRQFARNMSGPVLELGCGSGRILQHLQSIDLPLVGVDTSNTMLEAARRRLGDNVDLIRLDMRALDELGSNRFSMVFCAINTFLHLPDTDSQLAALASIEQATQHDGVLLIDVFVPQPEFLIAQDRRLEIEFSTWLEDGSRLDKISSRSHDLASQTLYTTVYYDLTGDDGSVSRSVGTYATRYIHQFEMEHLLARTGWDIVSLYGGYDLHPFDSESERMIFVATPAREE
jgi:SAM-dependent methyltransferase